MTNILTIDELKNSVLNANIDDEYIQPAIDEAQSIYLREILGDALLNAIINKINSNNLTGKYLTLVNDYVKPYLSYMIQSIIVVPITYKIRNAGVIQQYDNGFTTTQMKDTQYLKDYYDGKAEFYGNRLTEWLRKNASDIVEYRLSASNVTNPTTTQNVTNIFLGGTKRGKCGGMIPSGGGTHDTVDWDDITNRPDFATVATSGSYDDLSNKPEIPSLDGYATEQWVENQGYSTFSGDYEDLTNKPELFSGDYNDLSNKPNLATVATSGSYDDLSDKPDLTEYVREADYNVDKQSIDNALADKVETDNLCRINNERLDTNSNFELVRTDSIATLTITQGGATKGTFIPDSGTDVTIDLDGGGSGSTDWSDITNKPNFATVATSGNYSDLTNKPDLASVATSGSYNDLSDTPSLGAVATSNDYNDLDNKPTIPTVNNATLTITQGGTTKGTFTANAGTDVTINLEAGGSGSTDWSDITNKPNFATVATSGNYSDLTNKPDLAQVATSGDYRDLDYKPSLAQVAESGDYRDLSNTPTIPTLVQANWTESDSSDPSFVRNKPSLGAVATSNDYRDLDYKPSLAQVAESGDYRDLSNTPNLGAVATSNDYRDLDNRPTIVTPVQADWDETDSSQLSFIKDKPTLATVATSGDYRDLSNTPNFATVATSGDYHDLEHTPSLGAVATSNDYRDLDNKPTIPTVNDGSLTIQKNGTTIATFTANDDTNKTANITVPTSETDLGLTTETWTFTLQDSTTVTKTVVIK